MKTKIQLAREKSFKDVLAEERRKVAGRKAIDKKSVTLHKSSAEDSASKAAGSTKGGVRPPSDDELTIINQFTGSPKSADEVAVFETLSANTLADRDDDYFTRDTIKGFAKLPEPFGPVGKSYMTGHDYSTMPVGRIFAVDTKTVKLEGQQDYEGKDPLFLTNKIYVPNTDQYKSMLENIDFGINWAVSVGVMLDAWKCSICDNDIYWFFCGEGHVKGAYYDPNSDEVDSWGWPKEVPGDTKGAVKMLGVMEGAKDFYELSQCFLGAQYFAGLDNKSVVKGVVKSADHIKAPFVLLSKSEAMEIPFAHTDERVVRALTAFEVEHGDNGALKWTDDEGLIWTYEPGDSVLCLGKEASDSDASEEVDKDGEGDQAEDHGGQDLRREASGESDGEPDDDGERDEDRGDDEVGQPDGQELGEDGEVDPDDSEATDDDESEEDDVSKAALLAAAKRVKAPTVVLSAIAEAGEEKAVDAVLLTLGAHIKEQETQIAALAPKAAMGDEYTKSLRTEALNWYVKAHQDPTSNKGVNTTTFEKLLDLAGDDVDLMKSLTEEQKGLAQAKFPASVRRSSSDTDPNEATVPDLPAGGEEASRSPQADKRVRRLHG